MKLQQNNKKRCHGDSGFSLAELLVVVAVILVISALIVPNAVTALRNIHLRTSVTDFAGLIQRQRLRAVQDNRYYALYVVPSPGTGQPATAYVDIYPQRADGTSGNGSAGPQDPRDPAISMHPDVVPTARSASPNVSGLETALASPASTKDTTIYFNARGIPCDTTVAPCGALGNLNSPYAYVQFFQSGTSGEWQAVTVNPAGRIQAWIYSGGTSGTWSKL